MKPCNGNEISPHEPLWHHGEQCPYCRDLRLLSALASEVKRMGEKNDELCDKIFDLEHPQPTEAA